jgi:hypothetical protein
MDDSVTTDKLKVDGRKPNRHNKNLPSIHFVTNQRRKGKNTC